MSGDRVQLRRVKGWRLPDGTISVARPTPWGNPFTIAMAIETDFARTERDARVLVVECFRDWLYQGDLSEWWFANGAQRWAWMRAHLGELHGRTLACWCRPGDACHADVLVEAARASSSGAIARLLLVGQTRAAVAPEPESDGERCMDCGSDYVMWWADTPLFLEVIGGHYGPGLLCPTCFDRRAREQGIDLMWRPHRWDDDAKSWMEEDVKAAIESWRQSPEYQAEKATGRSGH